MATRTITVQFKAGTPGVLTDPTSIVLSDETDTYGVKRADTDAVIVVAGTAMTKASTGVYYHVFTEPELALLYDYVVEINFNGSIFRYVRTITGSQVEPPASTLASKVYRGDVGLVITADLGEDLAAATGLSFEVTKPDGDEVSWTTGVTLTTDSRGLQYTIAEGDLDQVGAWKIQPRFALDGWTGRASTVNLQVHQHGT